MVWAYLCGCKEVTDVFHFLESHFAVVDLLDGIWLKDIHRPYASSALTVILVISKRQ